MSPALRLLCLSTLLTVGGFAAVQPLAVTVMETQGLSATTTGLLLAMIFGGVLVLAPFQPKLVKRFGAMQTYQTGKLIAALGFAVCAWSQVPWLWAGALLLLGLGGALTWPLTDSLIASEAPLDKKGAWMGLFQSGMGLAFALGPFISAVLATRPGTVFLGAASVCVLSSVPLLGRRFHPTAEEDEEGLRTTWRSAAGFAVVAFLGGVCENGAHTAGTLAALALGWRESAAIALAGVIGGGAFIAQYPLGRVADRIGVRQVLLLGLAVQALSLAALPLVAWWQPLLWMLGFVWGGSGGCLYTQAMTGAAQVFKGTRLVAATTIMVISFTIGGVVGPVLGGCAVDISPVSGVVWVFVPLALAGWVVTYFQKAVR